MPIIPKVPAFKSEPESGHMAFLAAQAALSAMGVEQSLARLAGGSGDAFKFVYDRAPVHAPLRDLRPADTLARAFAACGLRAEWVPDATLDHVRGQVEAHAAIGQPVLASGLPGTPAGAFCLLVGYDEDSDTLSILDPAADPLVPATLRRLALADGPAWDGPLTGTPHWASFPMLVVRGPLYDPADETDLRRAALQAALDVIDGEPLAYPEHPGAQAQANVPLAGRSVPQGPAALDALAQDLAEADLADAALRWRVAAQLAQLAWDRHLAVVYLESWEASAPAGLIAHYRSLAHSARTLLSRNREQRSAAMDCVDDLKLLISGTAAYCYALPADPKLIDGVADLGQILDTPEGTALLVDSPKRRQGAVTLAGRLAEQERACRALLAAAQVGL